MSNEVTKTVDPHITLDLIVNTTITLTEQQWDEIKEIKGGRRESIDFYSDSSIYRAIFAHINKVSTSPSISTRFYLMRSTAKNSPKTNQMDIKKHN